MIGYQAVALFSVQLFIRLFFALVAKKVRPNKEPNQFRPGKRDYKQIKLALIDETHCMISKYVPKDYTSTIRFAVLRL
jgi:hypothetical protein